MQLTEKWIPHFGFKKYNFHPNIKNYVLSTILSNFHKGWNEKKNMKCMLAANVHIFAFK